MRQLTPVEVLSLAKLLEMETNALTLAKTSLMAVTDEQLKTMAQAGIATTQARVAGIQQFIMENDIVAVGAGMQAQSQSQSQSSARQEGF
jgi:hypothetical protein